MPASGDDPTAPEAGTAPPSTGMPVRTWRHVLGSTEAAVGARPPARWLCEEASGAFGADLDEALDEVPTARMMAHLDSMLERLAAGEPLQYVLGHWSFRHLDLLVDRRVLIPRPETEVLAGIAIDLMRAVLDGGRASVRCADLGTGSGAIGLSLALELPRGATEVWLSDVSSDALDVARANLAGIGVAGRGVRVVEGSWFDALPVDLRGSLDLVASNPPYVADGDPDVEASVRDWEPATAVWSGAEGLEAHRALCGDASAWLRPGGWLLCEIGSGQGSAVAALMSAGGLGDVEVRADLAGRDRIVMGRRPD